LTTKRSRDLGKLTHKQTTFLALGLWRELRIALAAHAVAVGTEAAIELREHLIRDAKNINTEGVAIEDEAASMTALISSIDFSFPT
jgi:hypothetical protein